ncbi:MAG: hypothetical protein APF84_11860 [Gracilibacter sp. BRH_c7a]|nr:MAG: hypothetical protein APF84_11860 [Gracilibacter sp. BRH_c7a]
MHKDKVMGGAIIGILADAVKLIVNYLLYKLGYTSVVFWQIIATRFLEKEYLFKPSAYIIGGIADITVTAGLGVLFVYSIQFIGRNYLIIKGIGYGLIIWVSLFGTLLGQSVQEKIPQTPSSIFVTIVAHFFFGLSLAVFTHYFYRSKKTF